jgi:type I site-specific restriction endonuclease
MENEALLHEMVQAVLEVVCQAPQDSLSPILAREKETEFHQAMAEFVAQYPLRKTLVFAASVKHAETLCEIINRWVPGRACWVCGTTPKDDRKQLFADYKSGRYMFLVNCAVATEGFDEPTIEVVVMARPTKSRALYSQMLGRSTRALPGVVDGPETPEARRAAIAASAKPCTTCVDFVGNCGKHSLITPADILGGNYEDDVVELAAANAQKADRRPADMDEELEKAKKEIEDRKAREAAKRAKIRVGGKYTVGGVIDVFKMFKVVPQRERGWERGKPVSEKMKAALERQKLWQDDMTYSTARQLCQGMGERREKGLCTYRQASALAKRGLPTDVSFDKAHEWMDKIAGNGWQVPADVKAEAQEFIVGKPV